MMEQLGYSPDSFLFSGLTRQNEYYASAPKEVTDVTPLAKLQRLQQKVYYDPALPTSATALDESMMTPRFEPSDEAFARVQKLIVDDLRDAVGRGLSERGLLGLKASFDGLYEIWSSSSQVQSAAVPIAASFLPRRARQRATGCHARTTVVAGAHHHDLFRRKTWVTFE